MRQHAAPAACCFVFGQRGFALPVTLAICAILTLIAGRFLVAARGSAAIVHQQTELLRARAAADGAVSLALIGVLGQSPEGPWPRDGRVVRKEFGEAAVEIAVQDELGLIDVNAADAGVLTRLFEATGTDAGASAAAAAIVRSRDFAEISDLPRVPGLAPDVLGRAAPFLTTRTGTSAVDPVTAPIQVLRSLPDLPDWVVATMVRERARASILPGSLPLLNDPDQRGAPRHRFLRIRAVGIAASGVRFARETEVELDPGGPEPYRFLSWRVGS